MLPVKYEMFEWEVVNSEATRIWREKRRLRKELLTYLQYRPDFSRNYDYQKHRDEEIIRIKRELSELDGV